MVDACPISGQLVDSNVCRVVAGFVVVVGVIAVATQAPLLLLALAIDFVMRGSRFSQRSPLYMLACAWTRMLGVHPNKVDRAPKKFAARIGAVLTSVSAVLLFSGLSVPGSIVAGVLVACAALEATFGFCVGCRMYSMLPGKIAEVVAR